MLYFSVRFNERDNKTVRKTTVDLIEVAHRSGGSYYLPYQLFYSKEQLRAAYPEVDDFFAAKQKYDPEGIFTNKVLHEVRVMTMLAETVTASWLGVIRKGLTVETTNGQVSIVAYRNTHRNKNKGMALAEAM